jgi:hypothetical protein
MPRFARKKDGTHAAIEAAFRARGWEICNTYQAPECPDFFAAKSGRTLAVEVKRKGGKLTPAQERFRAKWTGEYYVVSSLEEAREISEAK